MCEVKMVNIEELRQKIHDEKMALIYARTKIQHKKNQKQKEMDAQLPIVHNEYIDYLRKHNLPITQADITKSIHPPHQKLSRDADHALDMLGAQYDGMIDGLKIHIAFILFCILILIWPLEWHL